MLDTPVQCSQSSDSVTLSPERSSIVWLSVLCGVWGTPSHSRSYCRSYRASCTVDELSVYVTALSVLQIESLMPTMTSQLCYAEGAPEY